MGFHTSAELINVINSYNKRMTLFTYALGTGADTTILKDLACQHGGIMFQIRDTSADSATLATTMRSYYTYISEGVSITSPMDRTLRRRIRLRQAGDRFHAGLLPGGRSQEDPGGRRHRRPVLPDRVRDVGAGGDFAAHQQRPRARSAT